jgi:hypothetical protein
VWLPQKLGRRKLGLAHTDPEFSQAPPNRSVRQKITTPAQKNPTITTFRPDRQSCTTATANIAKMADSDSPVTLRTRKFIRNPLLGRKQMVV